MLHAFSGWPEPVGSDLAPGKEIELSDFDDLTSPVPSEKSQGNMPWTPL